MFLYMLLLKNTWVFERMHVCYREHRIHHLSSLGPRVQGGALGYWGYAATELPRALLPFLFGDARLSHCHRVLLL